MITYKFHKSGQELVLGACDIELVGKTLKASNGAQIFINPNFYKDKTCTAQELKELIQEATIINLFGTETINAVKEQCIRIIKFDNFPHAQIFKSL